jgi:hypothetical protein
MDAEQPGASLLDPNTIQCPYDFYDDARNAGPVHYMTDMNMYLVM